MPVCDDSKSSTYELPCDEPDFCLCGTSCAYSAVRFSVDGAVALTVGILFNRFVSHMNLVLYATLKPKMELFITSSPMLTFSVMAFSEKCMIVAPILRFLLMAYCRSSPRSVLRCIEKSDWFSSVTLMLCPESMMLWLVMVTIPME